MMKANIGSTDRVIRIVVGLALIVWAVVGHQVWAWIGVIPLGSALIRFCPAYMILGMNTCGVSKE